VNGHGTLLSTEECYLSRKVQVRNPGLGRKGFEAALRENLGVTNIFWLGGGVTGDDTHGHVDDICRFVNRQTVVLIREENPKDINYRPLAENWERIGGLRLEDGSKPEVVALPMPAPLTFKGERLPASYANFYIANAAVIVPTFNDPKSIWCSASARCIASRSNSRPLRHSRLLSATMRVRAKTCRTHAGTSSIFLLPR
ncbi:MAG: agmatine deiminase family protein, partial [Bryobacteraceae bacterium]